jgi:hypothetical protein
MIWYPSSQVYTARSLKCLATREWALVDLRPGANPTIASYNANVVKIYSAVNSMAHFRLKIIFLRFKNSLAYYNAGLIAVN